MIFPLSYSDKQNHVTSLETGRHSNLQVEIDLDLNAYANARAHYENRKAKMVKQVKTVEQNERALLAAEKTAQLKLTQASSEKLSLQLRAGKMHSCTLCGDLEI